MLDPRGLNIIGVIIYSEGNERLQQRKASTKKSGRRQKGILQLVKERRRLRQFKAREGNYARSLLEEKKTGTLYITKQELENHTKTQSRDSLRESPLGSPGYIP
ncbi:uncharacterized protein LOC107739136, partial [Tachysurus ichikawai]